MSDRIAVMKNGVFQQFDTPSAVYDRPKNAYVARFVGSANILRGKAAWVEDELFLDYDGTLVPVTDNGADLSPGEELTVAVRSEYIDFDSVEGIGIEATVKEKSFSAGMLRIALETERGDEVIASRHGIDYNLSPGEAVRFTFRREHALRVEESDES